MKFVIFDIDGTLTNTKKVEDRCFMKSFEETFGISIYNQKWESFKHVTDWGITEEIIQREWKREPTKIEYEAMIANFVANLKQEKIKDKSQFDEVIGAKALFSRLKATEEFKLGIATGAWEESAKLKLENIGIDMDNIAFSNSNYHKSRETIVKDVIAQLTNKNPQNPEEIIYFGDGEWDYKTCQNIKIKFFGIDINQDGKLKKLGAKTIFRDYSNQSEIIQELKKSES